MEDGHRGQHPPREATDIPLDGLLTITEGTQHCAQPYGELEIRAPDGTRVTSQSISLTTDTREQKQEVDCESNEATYLMSQVQAIFSPGPVDPFLLEVTISDEYNRRLFTQNFMASGGGASRSLNLGRVES